MFKTIITRSADLESAAATSLQRRSTGGKTVRTKQFTQAASSSSSPSSSSSSESESEEENNLMNETIARQRAELSRLETEAKAKKEAGQNRRVQRSQQDQQPVREDRK